MIAGIGSVDGQVSFDTLLKLAEVLSILGGGGLVAFRLGRTTTRVEAAMLLHGREISELKTEMKQVSNLLTQVALQGQRLDTQDKRLDTLDRRYEELRHGEGFVVPAPGRMPPPKDKDA